MQEFITSRPGGMDDALAGPSGREGSDSRLLELQIQELQKRQLVEREGLGLLRHPVQTLALFYSALIVQLRNTVRYMLENKLALIGTLLFIVSFFVLAAINGPHSQFVHLIILYSKFGVWWTLLGVASSIGLGSGLHTFVLYLGPHIARFTLKATLCGRVDLKRGAWDTLQWGSDASWASVDCAVFGPPEYPRLPGGALGYGVRLRDILAMVQLEAFLWGLGTAIGELPPYFVSRTARLSGERLRTLDELQEEEGSVRDGSLFRRWKLWFFSQGRHFGFFTILVFASVPNPLFDLAGITCGHFLVPFWKFFFATCIGKAIIKVHIQTVIVILVFNAHSVDMVESLMLWLLQRVPHAREFLIPQLMDTLQGMKGKFSGNHSSKVASSKLSFALVWNSIVMLMVGGFIASIVTSMAKAHLIEEQKHDLLNLQSEKERYDGDITGNHNSSSPSGSQEKKNE